MAVLLGEGLAALLLEEPTLAPNDADTSATMGTQYRIFPLLTTHTPWGEMIQVGTADTVNYSTALRRVL
jgi:hypothetical protein